MAASHKSIEIQPQPVTLASKLSSAEIMMFGTRRPGARAVARRAAILKSVVVTAHTAPSREWVDDALHNWSAASWRNFEAGAEQHWKDVWRDLGKLQAHLTPWERKYFANSAANLTERQQIDATWRIESLQVLLWALGRIESLPPYDAEADLALLKQQSVATKDGLNCATLRPRAEIDRARDIAELWHWRSRTRELIEEARPLPDEIIAAGFKTYDDIIKLTVAKAAEDGVTSVIDNDFSLMGKAYRTLTDEEWSSVRSLTIERHFALNWLCGFAPKNQWDETPTET